MYGLAFLFNGKFTVFINAVDFAEEETQFKNKDLNETGTD
jgi:hypothetical protein